MIHMRFPLRTMSSRIRVLALTVTLLTITTPSFAQEDPSQRSLSLEQAIKQLDESIEQSGKPNADDKIRESAATLSFVFEQEGIASSDGELTLGNAYFIAGDLGRAVLHYRKGLQIDPSHELLRKNLAHARSFVEPSLPENNSQGWIRTSLLSWHQITDRWTLWLVIVTLLALASISCSLRIVDSKKRVPIKVPLVLAAFGFLGLSILSYDAWISGIQRDLVIVTPGTGFFSGPSRSVYQEIYDQPLGIGTEAIVLDRREGWVNIRLSNAQEGWIMDDQGALITQ